MSVELNHTIVHAKDNEASAQWMVEMFDLEPVVRWGPFVEVHTANGVALGYINVGDYPYVPQHYAFLVSDAEFDAIFGRVQARGLDYWADPHKDAPKEINHEFGGRGVYFEDPAGHLLEIITKPYDLDVLSGAR
jgi:catechol 2,3-dioxygenase-like lactoylglutathione lyase family enzyme